MAKLFIQDVELLKKLVKEAVIEATAHLSQKTEEEKELLSMQQAVEMLHVTRQTIRNWEKKGLVKPIRVGGRVLFLKDELLANLTGSKNG